MEKSVAWIFVLLLLAPSCFAEEIFSDYIAEEESATIDNDVYTAHEYNDYTGVRLSSNKYGSIILEEQGSSTVKGPYTFTLDEILEEDNEASFKITVDKEEASVTISREASATSTTISSEITVTVTITNNGDDATSVTYSEDLPTTVIRQGTPEITKGTATTSQKSTIADVYWNGVLYEGESATIVYTFKVRSYPTTGTSIALDEATFTYSDDYGSYSDAVDSLSISLEDPVSVSFTSDADEISLDQEVMYTLTIDNSLDTTVDISSLLLELPDIPITAMDTSLEETTEGYAWSGNLAPYEDLSFTFYVQPDSPGTYSFTATAAYEYNDAEMSSSETTAFSIEAADVVPEIVLSSTTFDGGEPIIIYYYVNNSDTELSYSSVDITIESPLFDTVHYATALPANQKILIKKQNFTTPYTDSALEYEIIMTGDIGSGNTFETTEKVLINPAEFTAPYIVEYTIDGVDEQNTNITMTLTLLTTFANMPEKLAVVHTYDDYKKTVSLTTEQITDLFSTQTYTRSWNIPTVTFTEDSIDMDVQLQYVDASGTYYKTMDSVAVPVYQEAVIETEEVINETREINETIEINGTIEINETTEEPEIIITGEEEQTTGKWLWFVGIVAAISGVAGAVVFLIKKKQKSAEIKKNIEKISGKKQESEESIFSKAKEIIIHDVPNPEEGYEKLESYIKHCFSQGKTEEEVKKILVAKGWIEDILDSYVRRLK
jgi:hypothetical protein